MFAVGEGEPLLVTLRLLERSVGWSPWLVPHGGLGCCPEVRRASGSTGGTGEVGCRPGRPRLLGSGPQPCSLQKFASAGLELHSRLTAQPPRRTLLPTPLSSQSSSFCSFAAFEAGNCQSWKCKHDDPLLPSMGVRAPRVPSLCSFPCRHVSRAPHSAA